MILTSLIVLGNTTILGQVQLDEASVCLDSIEAKAVELLFNENKMLHEVSEAQRNEIEFYQAAEMFYRDKIQSLTAIIKNKDDQIKELERVRIPIIKKSNEDWYWYMAGGSAITVIAYLAYKVLVKK